MLTNEEQPIQFRSVHLSDLETVYAFLQPFMAQDYLLKRSKGELGLLLECGFLAFAGDEIVGFAAVEVYSKKLAELQCLAVSPAHRRKGIGKQLVNYCCEAAAKFGVRELMAISASDEMFVACGFDYSLPNQKRALFYRPENGAEKS